MALNIGSTTIGSLYLGSTKIAEAYIGSTKVFSAGGSALAPRSMRFDFKYDHFNPITGLTDLSAQGFIWTHVADDVYDFHYDNADWGVRTISGSTGGLFNVYRTGTGSSVVYPMTQHQFDVLDMDMTGVTTVSSLFASAWSVQNIFSIRNTSSVTNFNSFIAHSARTVAIPSLPLFDTSSAVDVTYMCRNTKKVNSGSLALYQQMSSQATPPSSYSGCFQNCGSSTTQGKAERAQIPTTWGGTMSV